ncbi:hypothetical protein ACFV23_39255 [Streptomyces sp. NPDC059627]
MPTILTQLDERERGTPRPGSDAVGRLELLRVIGRQDLQDPTKAGRSPDDAVRIGIDEA